MSSSSTTVDHDEIRKWAEERGGRPSVVRTGGKGGVLRLDFREKEEGFDEISWDEFFEVFEESQLAFLHQDETADGQQSRFNKFVSRGEESGAGAGKSPGKRAAAGKRGTAKAGAKAAGKAAGGKTARGSSAKSAAAKSEKAPAKTAAAGKKAAAGKAAGGGAAGKTGAKTAAKRGSKAKG